MTEPQRPAGSAVAHAMGHAIEWQMAMDKFPGLLPDHMIRNLALAGMIEPFSEGVQKAGVISYGLCSAGYDCRLATRLKVFNDAWYVTVDPKNIDLRSFVSIDTDVYEVPPGGYVLGETVEYFNIPRDIVCLTFGKSTYARVGISLVVTPGDPEWSGKWTIGIKNNAPVPVTIYAMEGIIQVLFIRTIAPCEKSYKDKGGRYNNADGLRHATVSSDESTDVTQESSQFGMKISGQKRYTSALTCSQCGHKAVFCYGDGVKYYCRECGSNSVPVECKEKE